MLKLIVLCLVTFSPAGFKIKSFSYIEEPWYTPLVTTSGGPYRYPMPQGLTVSYVDSSRNQYTFWTQIQDPVHYSENGDTVVLIWRGYEVDGTGYVAAAMTIDEGNSWLVVRRINEMTGVMEGGGRNPSASLQGGRPIAGFAELNIPVDWGYLVDVTGAFSKDSSQWCGYRSPSVGAYKCVPMRLPDDTYILNLGLSETAGFIYSKYNIMDCVMYNVFIVDAGFSLKGGDYHGDTIMAFGYNQQSLPIAYVYEADTDAWVGQITLHTPGIDTLPNGEILNEVWWADGIILNNGIPIMVAAMGDGTGIDTVMAGRNIWVLRPDTAVRIWIAPNPDPINHVAYSQLSIDRETGKVYVFWMQLDEWRGDTTGYGSWDIWYSYSTDNGYSWSEPVNLTNTTGADEAMFQVAKRVVNGRAWLAFLRPMNNQVTDLYWQVLTDYGDGVTPVYVYLGYAPNVGVQEKNATFPENASIVGNSTLRLTLNKPEQITLKIFDITGRRQSKLYLELPKGIHTIPLPVKRFPQGVYLLYIRTESRSWTIKLTR